MKLVKFAAVAALLMGAHSASAATIVSAVGATASNQLGGYEIGKTINQSGLSSGYTSGVTDFDTYIGSGPTHTLSASDEWFTETGVTDATVTYDLGSVMSIDRMALWGEESSGFSNAGVYGSADGITYSLLSMIAPVDNLIGSDYGAEIFGWATAAIQFVQLRITGCPQPENQYAGCAMGEIAFSQVAAVPVPGSILFLMTGFGALVATRRRKKA